MSPSGWQSTWQSSYSIINARTPPRCYLPTTAAGFCNGWRSATALSAEPVQGRARVAPVWPPGGAARLPGHPREGAPSTPPGPARRLPTRRQKRFAGPEDLSWGPHLRARDPSGRRSQLDHVYERPAWRWPTDSPHRPRSLAAPGPATSSVLGKTVQRKCQAPSIPQIKSRIGMSETSITCPVLSGGPCLQACVKPLRLDDPSGRPTTGSGTRRTQAKRGVGRQAQACMVYTCCSKLLVQCCIIGVGDDWPPLQAQRSR